MLLLLQAVQSLPCVSCYTQPCLLHTHEFVDLARALNLPRATNLRKCRIGLNFGMEICKTSESNCESSFFTVKCSESHSPRVWLMLAWDLVGSDPCLGNPD